MSTGHTQTARDSDAGGHSDCAGTRGTLSGHVDSRPQEDIGVRERGCCDVTVRTVQGVPSPGLQSPTPWTERRKEFIPPWSWRSGVGGGGWAGSAPPGDSGGAVPGRSSVSHASGVSVTTRQPRVISSRDPGLSHVCKDPRSTQGQVPSFLEAYLSGATIRPTTLASCLLGFSAANANQEEPQHPKSVCKVKTTQYSELAQLFLGSNLESRFFPGVSPVIIR